jgi:Rrf2 family protein
MRLGLALILSYSHDIRQNIIGPGSMWLSSTAQQAIHAVVYIAATGGDGPVRVGDVARALGCPRNYLSKTLHGLVRAGVLRSVRGPRGGFRLSDAPERLTLARIIAPFEPIDDRPSLVGGRSRPDLRPAAALTRWTRLAKRVDEFFATTTVAGLLGDASIPSTRQRASARAARSPNPRMPHGPIA